MLSSRRSLQAGSYRGILLACVVSCIPLLQILVAHVNISSTQNNLVGDLSFNAPLTLTPKKHARGLSETLREYERNIGPKNSIVASPKPFLVVCNDINPALVPMFSDFSIVRLKRNEKPPEWNATVFLEPSGCDDDPYVKEAMRLREQSSYLSAPGISSAENGTWLHGVS